MNTQINYLFKSDRYDDNSQTSIGDMDFGSTQLDGSNDFNDDQVITLTQNSVLVRKCEHSLQTDKFLKYNDINWDKIIYLDINPEPYFTGMAQKVLDNLIFNSQDFLIIHHYTYNENSRYAKTKYDYSNGKFIDYINSLENLDKKIYLEYIIRSDNLEILDAFEYIRKEIFEIIEIHYWYEKEDKVFTYVSKLT